MWGSDVMVKFKENCKLIRVWIVCDVMDIVLFRI